MAKRPAGKRKCLTDTQKKKFELWGRFLTILLLYSCRAMLRYPRGVVGLGCFGLSGLDLDRAFSHHVGRVSFIRCFHETRTLVFRVDRLEPDVWSSCIVMGWVVKLEYGFRPNV